MFSDTGFVKTTSAVKYSTTISDMELKNIGSIGCYRKDALPRDNSEAIPKGWIRGDPRIGLIQYWKMQRLFSSFEPLRNRNQK